DPDQSIYGWRGADINNILEFERDFPEAKVIRLEQNYRSTKRILTLANHVIAANRLRKEKNLWTDNPEGECTQLWQAADGREEAEHIAARIAELHAGGRPCGDMAVFYRVNALSRQIEDALRRAHIPYRIARGVEFYNRKEIKDAVAYLRVLVNPADEVSLLRIINMPPRGIGKTTINRLLAGARRAGRTLLDTLYHQAAKERADRAARLTRFCQLLDLLRPLVDGPVRELLVRTLHESGLQAHYHGEDVREQEAWENLQELISSAAEFDQHHPDETLVDFLAQISLVSDTDVLTEDTGAVTLMTLHAAKGLEFPAVFIAALEEGIVPHARVEDNEADIEEERRLLFVGLTRARERLFLSLAAKRMTQGRIQVTTPSRFLSRLPEDVVEVGIQQIPEAQARHLESDRFESWEEGELVRHPKYGLGRVLWIDHGVDSTRAGVRFESHSEKTFILEYSDLKRIRCDDE
ncbi:MAG: ATP-binding domain-containing protein, partial [Phycisphaerales bacterium]